MSIARKTLTLSLVGSTIFILLTSVLVAMVSYNIAGGFLEEQSKDRLVSIRDIQKSQLEQYLSTIEKQVITFSNNEMISTAADYLTRTYRVFDRSVKKKAKLDIADMRAELRKFYQDEFGAIYLKQNLGASLDPAQDILDQLSDKAVYVQYYFLLKNEHPIGEKYKADKISLNSAYTQTHKRFHPFIRKYLQEFGYDDIFLIDPKEGHIVYSTAKEIDFGSSLITGPFKDSSLAKVFKEAKDATNPDFVSFEPFSSYTPSMEAPASFIASPIFNAAGKVSAVLAFQLPIDKINKVLTYNKKWKEHGLGDTGETYLVGQDYKIQSQDRLLEQDPNSYFEIIKNSNLGAQTINNIKVKSTSVGFQQIRTDATKLALEGQSGFTHLTNYRGKEVLSAYAPIEFSGKRFALVAELEEDEAFAYQGTMISSVALSVLVIAAIVLTIVGILVWKGSRVFSGLLLDAVSIANTVAQGKSAKITGSDRDDEIGSLMQALDRMQSELIAGYEERAVKTARITNALNVANTNMMVVDKHYEIVYVNQSLVNLFASEKDEWLKVFPGVPFDNLVGQNLDALASLPGLSRTQLSQDHLNQTHESEVGNLTVQITTNSVSDEAGNRIGTVVELRDRSEELAALRAERAVANENVRIKEALDNVNSSVMVANAQREVIYLNKSALQTLSIAETDIQSDLPSFSVDSFRGELLESFHTAPEEHRQAVESLSDSAKYSLNLGERTFDFIMSPVVNEDSEKLGTVVELNDRTDELALLRKERAVANENVRIREALDNVNSSVVVADADRQIIYLNKSAINTLSQAEKQIKQDLKNFDVSNLKGQNLETLHTDSASQRGRISSLNKSQEYTLSLGGRTFDFTMSPVLNEDKERLGTVVELSDLTEEKLIEQEVDDLVAAASEGDLSRRIEMDGKQGFIERLSLGLNKLIDINENFTADIEDLFSHMARGDLSHTIDSDYMGQFEKIKTNANESIAKLNDVMSRITMTSDSVSGAANDVSSGGTKLTSSTEQQASSLEHTANNMEKINSVVKENSESTAKANEVAVQAKDKAQIGGETVQEAIDAMGAILEASNRINDIIGVIDAIAFQTNLLALNAAVEAARAGDQGRGFAVVAGEVRSLSQRSAEAAKEIKELINDSVKKVDIGSDLVNQSGETLKEIVDTVQEVANIIDMVNESAVKQSEGIEQINHEISQMERMTQQNASLVDDVSRSSQMMIERSNEMKGLVNFFRTK